MPQSIDQQHNMPQSISREDSMSQPISQERRMPQSVRQEGRTPRLTNLQREAVLRSTASATRQTASLPPRPESNTTRQLYSGPTGRNIMCWRRRLEQTAAGARREVEQWIGGILLERARAIPNRERSPTRAMVHDQGGAVSQTQMRDLTRHNHVQWNVPPLRVVQGPSIRARRRLDVLIRRELFRRGVMIHEYPGGSRFYHRWGDQELIESEDEEDEDGPTTDDDDWLPRRDPRERRRRPASPPRRRQ